MKILLITSLIAIWSSLSADLVSPDGQFSVAYIKAAPYDSNVVFKNTKTGKKLGTTFSYGYEPQNFLETAWSADSRYLAVISRGTQTTTSLSVFEFNQSTVREIRIPDYRLNLLGRKNLVKGGRYHRVKKLSWEKTTITFHCHGQWLDGSGDPSVEPNNWYQFEVSLKFGGPGVSDRPSLAKVKEMRL